ncbi:Uncharacterised protein [Prevotella nigrescens]|nr:Uncharacterised protein [Prevotella nigrescens]
MNIKEEILEHTNRGLEIFSFYMPIDFVPKRNFRNPLYEDRRASCNIYFDTRSKCYRMKDFGNEMYSGDCFWFAAAIQGLDMQRDFMRVLKMIINDLQLNIPLPYHDWSEKSKSNANIPPKPPISMNASKQAGSKKWFRIAEQSYKDNELGFGHGMVSERKPCSAFRSSP